jgi:uncharacterized Zn finger protein
VNVALITARDLERLAGPERFHRGLELLAAVEDLYEDEHSLCATVHDDGKPYLAMVHHDGGGECECPDGGPPGYCQHSVAVGLSNLGDVEIGI